MKYQSVIQKEHCHEKIRIQCTRFELDNDTTHSHICLTTNQDTDCLNQGTECLSVDRGEDVLKKVNCLEISKLLQKYIHCDVTVLFK